MNITMNENNFKLNDSKYCNLQISLLHVASTDKKKAHYLVSFVILRIALALMFIYRRYKCNQQIRYN
jgi:transposase